MPPDAAQVAMEPRRRAILELIWDGERSVGDIADRLPVTGPAVSQHLRRLREAGLVDVRVDGRHRYYVAARERMGSVADLLEASWGRLPSVAPRPGAPSRPDPAPAEAAPRSPSTRPAPRRTEVTDELSMWYRQGLGARLTALLAARKALEASQAGAADSVRRLAHALARARVAERFPAVAAAADMLRKPDQPDLVGTVDRVVGALRQAMAEDEAEGARILVVEDSRVEAFLTRQVLTGPNREVLLATTADEAREIVEASRIDLIVLDLTLPGADGRDLLMHLSERPLTATIPVILLTSRNDVLTRTESLALGAAAYHAKPVDPQVLSASVAMMLERAAETRQLGRRDPLTGLKNRAVFLDEVRQLEASARRSGAPLELALIEVDRLAEINEAHGSAEGDRVLRALADALRASFRETDALSRWGGDQFAVLLLDADSESIEHATTTLARLTEAHPVVLADGTALSTDWHAGTAPIASDSGIDEAVARATRRLQIARRRPAGAVVRADQGAEGPPRVLLVEDDEILGDLMQHRLSREGFEVVHLSDGTEALARLSEMDVSAVVVDTMLPGADGFEILTRIRASPSSADVPVVVLTFGGRDDASRALKLGANDSMAKPFAVEELVARVARLVAEYEGAWK